MDASIESALLTIARLRGARASTRLAVPRGIPDGSDYLEIAADPSALADMLNAADPAPPVHVPCLVVLLITGPPGPVSAL